MDPASLQNLHDIITPAPISWLPPAPGWYALSFNLLLLLAWFSVKRYQIRQRNRYRREALLKLSQIEKGLADPNQYQQLLPRLPELVKRTAIAAYGRAPVASLSGSDWLKFLDKTGSTNLFSEGYGKLLRDCSYQSNLWMATLSSEKVNGLCKVVHCWIKTHSKDLEDV
jgi:hypothetical protein